MVGGKHSYTGLSGTGPGLKQKLSVAAVDPLSCTASEVNLF